MSGPIRTRHRDTRLSPNPDARDIRAGGALTPSARQQFRPAAPPCRVPQDRGSALPHLPPPSRLPGIRGEPSPTCVTTAQGVAQKGRYRPNQIRCAALSSPTRTACQGRTQPFRADGAQVGPVVTKVEDVGELLSTGQGAELQGVIDAGVVGRVVSVPVDEQPLDAAEVDHMQWSADRGRSVRPLP